MRIIRLIGPFLGASLCFAVEAPAQSSGAQSTGTPTGQSTVGMPGHADMPTMQTGPYADSALLTGPLGTRAPTGIATVEGRTVRLSLTGDQPGSARAWYVHRGSCTREEGVVGSARGYSPLVIDSRGAGSGSVALDAPFLAGGAYFVAVHASASDPKSEPIACGPLTKGVQSTVRSAAQSTSNGSMGNMPMGNMPMGNMPGMDHSAMTMPGMGGPSTMNSTPDSVSALVSSIYARLMADPVIRERAMTDPVLRSMLARVPSTLPPGASSGAAMSHDGMNMPGMSMSAPSTPTRRAARPTPSKSAPRPVARSSSSKPPAKPTQRSVQKPAAKPAPKPAAKPAPKTTMPPMPGMDHSNMPGMSKP